MGDLLRSFSEQPVSDDEAHWKCLWCFMGLVDEYLKSFMIMVRNRGRARVLQHDLIV